MTFKRRRESRESSEERKNRRCESRAFRATSRVYMTPSTEPNSPSRNHAPTRGTNPYPERNSDPRHRRTRGPCLTRSAKSAKVPPEPCLRPAPDALRLSRNFTYESPGTILRHAPRNRARFSEPTNRLHGASRRVGIRATVCCNYFFIFLYTLPYFHRLVYSERFGIPEYTTCS
ncbi:hypothetical protein CALCODRAFT_280847 [Calocera cornea HHB12733]|uniref:Uncharacterized protein n=1 Tax=Calocera cornea HHB12733 TaxID=1353952 RepID=A0A165G0B3_9BASI|nr:hypothetical protein CALCODRAFT_280847 [Calocera cornea HHB12733]